MELRDYGTALRRYWRTWAVLTAAGLLCALTIVLLASPSYQARAQVFVASTGDGTSSSQFISQRVKSYPDVAVSRTVLAPVIDELGLKESFAALRAHVSATNPPDTSQIEILVTDGDARRAAAVANAIARRFGTEVEDLERPTTGGSPVALTVTDPATVPATAVFPDSSLLLLLGGVVGLALGAAAAVVRSRVDTRVFDETDFRAGWGADDQPPAVLGAPARRVRRRRRNGLVGRPATILARRLAGSAAERPVQILVMSLSPDDRRPSQTVAHDVLASLATEEIRAVVTDDANAVPQENLGEPGVELVVCSPAAPMRTWRRLAARHDGVVLVIEPGRSSRTDVAEIRSILATARLALFAVVLERQERRATAIASGAVDVPAREAAGRAPAHPSPRTPTAITAGRR